MSIADVADPSINPAIRKKITPALSWIPVVVTDN
jgi:hypothetical protein